MGVKSTSFNHEIIKTHSTVAFSTFYITHFFQTQTRTQTEPRRSARVAGRNQAVTTSHCPSRQQAPISTELRRAAQNLRQSHHLALTHNLHVTLDKLERERPCPSSLPPPWLSSGSPPEQGAGEPSRSPDSGKVM